MVPSHRETWPFDGRKALLDLVKGSVEYRSLEQAVASLAVFAHPDTVKQTENRNLFRVIRQRELHERGRLYEYGDTHGRVMYDDNHSPTWAFDWTHAIKWWKDRDIQYNHVWSRSREVEYYTSLANLCVTPTFLAKLTDGEDAIALLLRYRAFCLYGFWPDPDTEPTMPPGYRDLNWADTLPAVPDLEATLLAAMRLKPRNSLVQSVREIGWFFSGFNPDPELRGSGS